MAKGGKGGDGGAGAARAEEQARQQRIREGTSSINSTFDSQFGDEFFGKRQQAYLDYASPQLNTQYDDAKKQLLFSLDRSGMTNSSVRAAKEAELQQLYDTNRRSVADQALTYNTQARNNIEGARADLINTLNATGDAQGATQSAISRATALSQPDAYSPLGQMFLAFTGGLGQQADAARTAALLSQSGTSVPNLFGARKTSTVVQQ
jgi:hypothetical protein